MFPQTLRNAIWHTTSDCRYAGIQKVGAILPEPSLSETERWGTARGPEFYPYVRSLGGVSLFDFVAFDEMEYERDYRLSNWQEFVPCCSQWSAAVWIELSLEALGSRFISGPALLHRWKSESAYCHRLMPLIEAAHVGEIPAQAFRRVLRYAEGHWHDLTDR